VELQSRNVGTTLTRPRKPNDNIFGGGLKTAKVLKESQFFQKSGAKKNRSRVFSFNKHSSRPAPCQPRTTMPKKQTKNGPPAKVGAGSRPHFVLLRGRA